MDIGEILNAVRDGQLSVEEAEHKIKVKPLEDIDFAKIDTHRELRQGMQEVIYGASKTAEQILNICKNMDGRGCKNILITRMSKEAAAVVEKECNLFYDELSKIGIVNFEKKDTGNGVVTIVSGGTSDIPVCEEAALTLEALGNKVERVYDVGVAGLHRLLSNLEPLMKANVVIAVAGMEGALASVVGGLVSAPVIAVPTSVGYGASFHGISALLSMLNSCASGTAVVNIDNGFGAAVMASKINHMKGKN